MVGHVVVAWDVVATKAAAGDEGGGRRRRRRRALLPPQLLEGVYDERSIYRRRGDEHGANSECTGVFRVLGVWSFPSARSFCVFVSRHKFYVCDFRTKHKICILAYHNLCFCVFVFLGMLHYLGRVPISFLVTRVAKYVRIVISRCPHNLDLRCMVCR